MHSIASMTTGAAAGLAELARHLPWAWFAVLAGVDAMLAGLVLNRRRAGRRASATSARAISAARDDTLVWRSGWRVPRSRAQGLPTRGPAYAWPLHTEYMVSRLD
jgi:hypothetical protein